MRKYLNPISCAALACAVATSANAQTSKVAEAPDSAPTTAGDQVGELSTAEQLGTGDIIVTAQKRAQNLQDVSLSITAFGGDALVKNQINDVTDFGSRIPNLNVTILLGKAQLTIRGIGVAAPANGVDPSVALHIDGAVVSPATIQLGAFFDLERVEVLRGPQGTLYGRNATGGVFNLITNKPTRSLDGYVRGTFGNYNNLIAEGAIGGPIVGDKILGRFAFRSENRSGFDRNEFNNEQINNAHRTAARGHLEFIPSDDIKILLTADWYRENDANYVPIFREQAYPNTTVAALRARGIGGYATNPRNLNSDIQPYNDRSTWSVNSDIDWRLGDAFGIKSITNFRRSEVEYAIDFDVSSVVTPSINNNYGLSKQFSQEIQFNFDAGEIGGIISAFYFNERQDGLSATGLKPYRNTQNRSLASENRGNVDVESWAIFGNLNYSISDTLLLNFGGRYTWEERKGNIYNLGVVIPYSPRRSFTNFSPKATLEWRPSADLMIYGTYSKGFKSGILYIGAPNPILDPEIATNYELGFKSQIFDRILTFNAAAFYTNFENLQVGRSFTSVTNPAASTNVFENAATAVSKGVEAEIIVKPTASLRLDASIGYVDATFTDYLTADSLDLPNAPTLQRAGNPLLNAPKWTINGGIDYTIGAWNGGKITFSADVGYKSKTYFSSSKLDRLSQPGFTIVDANIRFVDPKDQLSVNFWVKNLTDELYWGGSFVNGTTRQILGSYGPPRTYGVTFGYNF